MTAAVVYAAKSTKDKRLSIPDELADCREMCAEHGWEIVGEFADENFTAYTGNRGPGLAAAITLAKETAVEREEQVMLIAQHTSRFARGDGAAPDAPRALVELFHEWARANVRGRLVENDRAMSSSTAAAIQGEADHSESKRKSVSVRKGLARTRKRGEWSGGVCPDGYVLLARVEDEPRRLELDPERAPVIRKVLELGLQGVNSGETARKLNADGLLAGQHRTRRLVPWTPARVRKTWNLAGGFYAGGGSWPAMCPPEQAARLQAIVAARAAGARPARRSLYFLLAHLLRCERCGAPMYAIAAGPRADGGRARRYRCKQARAANGQCDAPGIAAERIEEPFVQHLDALTVDLAGFVARQAADLDAQRGQITASIERERVGLLDLDRAVEAVRADYTSHLLAGREDAAQLGVDTLADLDRRREQAQHRADHLLDALGAVPEEPDGDAVASLVDSLRAALAGRLEGAKTVGDANARLREAIDSVDVDVLDGGTVKMTAYMSDSFLWSAGGDPNDHAVAEFAIPQGARAPSLA